MGGGEHAKQAGPSQADERARMSTGFRGLLERSDDVGRREEPPRYESGLRAHGSNQRFHRLLRHAVARALTTAPSLIGVSPAAETILIPQGWRRKGRPGRCRENKRRWCEPTTRSRRPRNGRARSAAGALRWVGARDLLQHVRAPLESNDKQIPVRRIYPTATATNVTPAPGGRPRRRPPCVPRNPGASPAGSSCSRGDEGRSWTRRRFHPEWDPPGSPQMLLFAEADCRSWNRVGPAGLTNQQGAHFP